MGWLTGWSSKRELISHLNSDRNVVKSCCRGDTLWQVVRHPKLGDIIACYLLARYDDEWGYKDMDEGMSPYRYSCPLGYLSITVELSPVWRADVRKWHATQKTKSREFTVLHNGIVIETLRYTAEVIYDDLIRRGYAGEIQVHPKFV